VAGPAREYVFGYGSLAAWAGRAPAVAELLGARRVWGVAMDNREAIPGYKVFLDPADGSRPAVHVAFLDLATAPPDAPPLNGVLVALDAQALVHLDARERNYERTEVTARIRGAPGRVWAYTGSAPGRARLAAGLRDGTAVVSRAYFDGVRGAFARLGDGQLERFRATTQPPPVPVRELRRVDLPPPGPARR
jgi:Gamma-glutamyl cyclotransferase, AIG2-like